MASKLQPANQSFPNQKFIEWVQSIYGRSLLPIWHWIFKPLLSGVREQWSWLLVPVRDTILRDAGHLLVVDTLNVSLQFLLQQRVLLSILSAAASTVLQNNCWAHGMPSRPKRSAVLF